MVGNVWQIMDDVYDNGVYRYGIIRGGSYYAPEKSEWYVKSGPLAVDRVQIHLLVAPGLDRGRDGRLPLRQGRRLRLRPE